MSLTDDDGRTPVPHPDERELPDEEVDARFRELTADLPDPIVDLPDVAAVRAIRPRRVLGPRDWPTTPEVEELEDAETHFTPPVPPSIRATNRLTQAAWLGLVASLLALVSTLFLPRALVASGAVRWLGFAAAAVFTLSLVYLIAKMPRVRDDDDTGAVV